MHAGIELEVSRRLCTGVLGSVIEQGKSMLGVNSNGQGVVDTGLKGITTNWFAQYECWRCDTCLAQLDPFVDRRDTKPRRASSNRTPSSFDRTMAITIGFDDCAHVGATREPSNSTNIVLDRTTINDRNGWTKWRTH
jgi:hypothetical protein